MEKPDWKPVGATNKKPEEPKEPVVDPGLLEQREKEIEVLKGEIATLTDRNASRDARLRSAKTLTELKIAEELHTWKDVDFNKVHYHLKYDERTEDGRLVPAEGSKRVSVDEDGKYRTCELVFRRGQTVTNDKAVAKAFGKHNMGVRIMELQPETK